MPPKAFFRVAQTHRHGGLHRATPRHSAKHVFTTRSTLHTTDTDNTLSYHQDVPLEPPMSLPRKTINGRRGQHVNFKRTCRNWSRTQRNHEGARSEKFRDLFGICGEREPSLNHMFRSIDVEICSYVVTRTAALSRSKKT